MPVSTDQSSYLADRMNEVSRSFALVVASLEEPLHTYMAAAYLLCRVADNIEDCGQPSTWRQHRFAQFQHLLEDPAAAGTTLAAWERLEWPGLTAPEKRMMGTKVGLPLWQIYVDIDDRSRCSIKNWVSTMAEGMVQFDDPAAPPRIVNHHAVDILADVSDYDHYCYYVAGTVGHMATEIVAQHYGFSSEVTATLTGLAEACGRSLQKTNILKDYPSDLQRGISYLPATWLEEVGFAPLSLQGAAAAWKQKVIANVMVDLRTAADYVLALPITARGYRISSLLCLLPAYQTLLLAAKRQATLFTAQHSVKITRPTLAKCQWDAQAMLSDNDAIMRYTSRMETAIDALFESGP